MLGFPYFCFISFLTLVYYCHDVNGTASNTTNRRLRQLWFYRNSTKPEQWSRSNEHPENLYAVDIGEYEVDHQNKTRGKFTPYLCLAQDDIVKLCKRLKKYWFLTNNTNIPITRDELGGHNKKKQRKKDKKKHCRKRNKSGKDNTRRKKLYWFINNKDPKVSILRDIDSLNSTSSEINSKDILVNYRRNTKTDIANRMKRTWFFRDEPLSMFSSMSTINSESSKPYVQNKNKKKSNRTIPISTRSIFTDFLNNTNSTKISKTPSERIRGIWFIQKPDDSAIKHRFLPEQLSNTKESEKRRKITWFAKEIKSLQQAGKPNENKQTDKDANIIKNRLLPGERSNKRKPEERRKTTWFVNGQHKKFGNIQYSSEPYKSNRIDDVTAAGARSLKGRSEVLHQKRRKPTWFIRKKGKEPISLNRNMYRIEQSLQEGDDLHLKKIGTFENELDQANASPQKRRKPIRLLRGKKPKNNHGLFHRRRSKSVWGDQQQRRKNRLMEHRKRLQTTWLSHSADRPHELIYRVEPEENADNVVNQKNGLFKKWFLNSEERDNSTSNKSIRRLARHKASPGDRLKSTWLVDGDGEDYLPILSIPQKINSRVISRRIADYGDVDPFGSRSKLEPSNKQKKKINYLRSNRKKKVGTRIKSIWLVNSDVSRRFLNSSETAKSDDDVGNRRLTPNAFTEKRGDPWERIRVTWFLRNPKKRLRRIDNAYSTPHNRILGLNHIDNRNLAIKERQRGVNSATVPNYRKAVSRKRRLRNLWLKNRIQGFVGSKKRTRKNHVDDRLQSIWLAKEKQSNKIISGKPNTN